MGLLRRIIMVLANGAILWFYSEFFFWGSLRPYDTIKGNLTTYFIYAVITYAFLVVVQTFRVRTIAALFLAGGIYGWLVEGVAVSTMYDNFPFQIPWTGLSWHAFLSVLLGWYAVKKVLTKNDYGETVLLCAVIAFFWSTWAAYCWTQKDFPPPSLGQFAFSAYLFSFFLILGYWLSHKVEINQFHPSRVEVAVLVLIALGWFLKVTISRSPSAAYILPPCLLVTFWALWKNRRNQPMSPNPLFSEVAIKPFNWLLLWSIPSLATFGYAQYQWQDVQIYMNKIFGTLSINAAVVMYLWCVIKIVSHPAAMGMTKTTNEPATQ